MWLLVCNYTMNTTTTEYKKKPLSRAWLCWCRGGFCIVQGLVFARKTPTHFSNSAKKCFNYNVKPLCNYCETWTVDKQVGSNVSGATKIAIESILFRCAGKKYRQLFSGTSSNTLLSLLQPLSYHWLCNHPVRQKLWLLKITHVASLYNRTH